MADVVMGAMGSLIPKLGELLKEEYNLQTGVKQRIRSLTLELEGAQAALRKVAEVPWYQLDEQVKVWAREVRESSYDMEDVLDTFLVRVQGRDSADAEQKGSLKHLREKMANLFKKSKARREISVGVKDIMTHLDEVTDRCRRYKVDDIVARPAIASTVDPRLAAMCNKVKNLVGIDKPSGELISMLQPLQRGDVLNAKMIKIVSVVGVGGLGKTTLAKAVYDKLKGDYDCRAFVPVGQNPDLKKVFKDILIDLDRGKYLQFNTTELNERHLIDEIRSFLIKNKKRYFIVIDDIWEIHCWETIKLAIDDDNTCGGRIIITTRNLEVATRAGEVYKLKPLPDDISRELFYTRISGDEGRCVENQPDHMSDRILKKCGGIPLAIITMASLLVGKPRDKWPELYKSIGFGSKDNKEADNTITKILSFSYYDLPSHLKTCLLYLSAFPEDSVIPKDSLVWKWVAEGFVREEQGMRLFEIGEGYFNDLINRSLIQVVEFDKYDNRILGCRVHDMVLDLIRSMAREENFITVLVNDRGTPPLQSNVRRLAQHNMTTHQANHFDDMPKVRSFSVMDCSIETWVPLSSFTLLRVLAIECDNQMDCWTRVEHLGHLLHLRYLSLPYSHIDKIPEEIGALKFLQTLDLSSALVRGTPSSSSLPTQLVCLHVNFSCDPANADMAWLERLTSLEELSIKGCSIVKELGRLRELRVLQADIFVDEDDEEESERDLYESLRHLYKLQHLRIKARFGDRTRRPTWKGAGLVLPRHLRHFTVKYNDMQDSFIKMPPCINPSCLPYLSHLDLYVIYVDEQGLKNLGGLPELRYLRLGIGFQSLAARISNISDSDAGYFPKLRCCRLPLSVVLFVANKEDKSISFHLWNGKDDDDLLQGAMPSDFDGDELDRPMIQQPRKLHHGFLAAAAAYYYLLLAFFQQYVLALVKRWWPPHIKQQVGQASSTPLICNREDAAIAMPSAASSIDDEDNNNNEDSICRKGVAVEPPFMPTLEIIEFRVRHRAAEDHRYCDNLGLEYLSSLRKIDVIIDLPGDTLAEVEKA